MISRAVLAAIAMAATSAVHADERTFTFDCDTPGGHYSSWTATTQASALVISGTLRINELRLEKRWVAVLNVFIRGGADGKTTYGFRAYDADKLQKNLHLELLKPGGHEDFGNDSLKAGRKPVAFRLELTTSGSLLVDVGGAKHSTELGSFKPKSIDLGCSTGDFKFDDVRIEEKP